VGSEAFCLRCSISSLPRHTRRAAATPALTLATTNFGANRATWLVRLATEQSSRPLLGPSSGRQQLQLRSAPYRSGRARHRCEPHTVRQHASVVASRQRGNFQRGRRVSLRRILVGLWAHPHLWSFIEHQTCSRGPGWNASLSRRWRCLHQRDVSNYRRYAHYIS